VVERRRRFGFLKVPALSSLCQRIGIVFDMTSKATSFKSKRLQTRLIVWTAIILTIVVTVVAEAKMRYNIHFLESNLKVRSETLVVALEKPLGHMASGPEVPIPALEQRLREYVEADRTLTRLDIVRREGGKIPLVATSSGEKEARVATIPEKLATWITDSPADRFMVTSMPLEGTPLALVAYSTLENIDKYEETNRIITPFFSLFLITAVIVPMSMMYSRTISKRFDELLEGIRRAKNGEISKVPDDREDEIGALAKTLNGLITQVRSFNDGLRLEVSRATEDLHKRNAELEATSRQMLVMQRQLLESERLATVGQMAATFAHEIGSPMSSISAHVQLLQEDPDLSRNQRETLGLIREQIQSVILIVNELLRSARRGPTDFVLTDINKIIDTVIRLVQPKLTSQRIAVRANLKSIPMMRGYPLYLQEVFLNLINNASEAMPGGGQLEVNSWFDEESGLLNITIMDTGPGIDPTVVEKMFDHFVTTKAIGAGAGLGLGIVKEIVDSHRGTVRIAPLDNVGTSAHLTFPAEVPVVHAL